MVRQTDQLEATPPERERHICDARAPAQELHCHPVGHTGLQFLLGPSATPEQSRMSRRAAELLSLSEAWFGAVPGCESSAWRHTGPRAEASAATGVSKLREVCDCPTLFVGRQTLAPADFDTSDYTAPASLTSMMQSCKALSSVSSEAPKVEVEDEVEDPEDGCSAAHSQKTRSRKRLLQEAEAKAAAQAAVVVLD